MALRVRLHMCGLSSEVARVSDRVVGAATADKRAPRRVRDDAVPRRMQAADRLSDCRIHGREAPDGNHPHLNRERTGCVPMIAACVDVESPCVLKYECDCEYTAKY